MKQSSETDSSHNSMNSNLELTHSDFENLFINEFESEIRTENEQSLSLNKTNKKNLFVSFIPPSNSTKKRKNAKKNKQIHHCSYEGCTKTYKSKENLDLHIKTKHKGLKPYKCSSCPLSFSHRNGRRYHERITHTKFLPYKCSLCLHEYATISAMKAHQKLSHKSKDETIDDNKVDI